MKRGILIVIPILVALALVFRHFPENLAPAPAIPDTGTSVATKTTRETEEVGIVISPATIRQGEPAMIVVNGLTSMSTVSSLTWNGKKIDTFIYKEKPTAFVGVDLKMTPGSYPVTLTLEDGTTLKKNLVVSERKAIEAPLGIPDQLGGNTPQAEQTLITTLAQENAILAAVPTVKAKLWTDDFQYPLKDPVITDDYGYTRLTGASTISHKGTDFHAPIGTEVHAMNSGTVALAREFRNYGNTVIIDHGFGVQTLYMHLSEILVKQGESITKGELIGKSGMTGYAEQPHLHISLKINGISIDPIKFLDLF